MTMRRMLATLLVLVMFGLLGCKIGRDKSDDPPSGSGEALESGESLGEIQRLPGGTPVATDVRTLLAATCADGRLTLRTSLEELTANMDCGQMLPASIVDQFVGQPVVVRADEGRIIVENATAGTMNFPASDARVAEAAGAP